MTVRFNSSLEAENSQFTAEWSGTQEKATNRITLDSAHTRVGGHAVKFVLQPGDNNVVGSNAGERAEIAKFSIPNFGIVGQDSYVGFSFWWDASYAPVPGTGWNTALQFHADAGGTQACAVERNGPKLNLVMNGGFSTSEKPFKTFTLDAAHQLALWYDIIIHVHWHYDPALGFCEAWVQKNNANGQQIVPKTFCSNLYQGGGSYLKSGFYRAPPPAGQSNPVAIGWGDCYVVADSLAEVIAAMGITWDGDGGGSVVVPTIPALPGGKVRYGKTVVPVGAVLNPMAANSKRGSAIVIAQDTLVDTIGAAIAQNLTSGTENLKMALYDSLAAAGDPGSAVAVSAEVAKVAPFSPSFEPFTVSPAVALKAGTYWAELLTGGTDRVASNYQESGTDGMRYGSDTYADGFASPAGAMSHADYIATFYVEGTLQAGGVGGGAGDTTPPTLLTAEINADLLTLSWSEPIDPASVPSSADFIVKVNGVQISLAGAPSNNGSSTVLRLASLVTDQDVVMIGSYTPGTNKIRDLSNNNAAALLNVAVINSTRPSSGAFPDTGVLDSFNRANGDPGGNWTLIQGDTVRPLISSNVLVGA